MPRRGHEGLCSIFPDGLENRGLLLLLAQRLTAHEVREFEAAYNQSSNLIITYKACEHRQPSEVTVFTACISQREGTLLPCVLLRIPNSAVEVLQSAEVDAASDKQS